MAVSAGVLTQSGYSWPGDAFGGTGLVCAPNESRQPIISHRPGLNLCSNVAHVQLGTALEMICIDTKAYCLPSLPVLTWYSLGTSARLTFPLVNCGISLTSFQFALTSIEATGNVMVLPNAARRPEILKRLF